MNWRAIGACAIGLWLAVSQPGVQAQGLVPNDGPAQTAAAVLHVSLERLLEVPADLPIDPPLREALEALAAEHLERMSPMFLQWTEDEAERMGPELVEARLQRRAAARYINELALSRLESPGPEYDAAILEAIRKPANCRGAEGRPYFARIAWLLQNVDPAKRSLVLDGERQLLARWGRSRSDVPPRPVPSQEERDVQFIAQLKEAAEAATVPMTPVLAAKALDDKPHRVSGGYACVLRQWGLERALAEHGAKPSDALTAYRYATLPLASEWLSNNAPLDTEAPTPGDYPRFAAWYEVEGVVTIEGRLDAEGRFLGARIVARRISVPGLGRARAVAFETVFDQATLARAAVAVYDKPEPSRLRDGVSRFRREYLWSLP